MDDDVRENVASSDIPETGPGLLDLPFEIRSMIWKLLLPGRRVFQARAMYGLAPTVNGDETTKTPRIKSLSPDASRWMFRVSDFNQGTNEYSVVYRGIVIPILLKICRDSRNFALQHGGFAFGNRAYSEPGMWWNPELDVLFFNYDWNLGKDTWALCGLSGLEHVRNIAIHSEQAMYICYDIGYGQNAPYWSRKQRDDVAALRFSFKESSQVPHYIPEFFDCLKSLIIRFEDLHPPALEIFRRCHAFPRFPRPFYSHEGKLVPEFWWNVHKLWGHPNGWHEAQDCCTITFNMGEDIKTACKKLARYRGMCYAVVDKPRRTIANPEFDARDNGSRLRKGPIYALKIGVSHILGWQRGIDFMMCGRNNPRCV